MTTNFVPPGWIPDEDRKGCALCKLPFSVFSRRHHCRLCGDIYCADCSNYTAIVPFLHNNHRPVRLCSVCHTECILNKPDRQLHHLSPPTRKNVRTAVEAFDLFDELEGEEDTHKDATPFKTVNPRGQEHRSRRHRTPTMTAGTGQQQRQRQQQHARDPSVDEVGGHLPLERLPSFHPVIVTTEVDLWWMGQKKSSHSPCSWSCIHTLTNVPVAASLEIGMEFCRPFSKLDSVELMLIN